MSLDGLGVDVPLGAVLEVLSGARDAIGALDSDQKVTLSEFLKFVFTYPFPSGRAPSCCVGINSRLGVVHLRPRISLLDRDVHRDFEHECNRRASDVPWLVAPHVGWLVPSNEELEAIARRNADEREPDGDGRVQATLF